MAKSCLRAAHPVFVTSVLVSTLPVLGTAWADVPEAGEHFYLTSATVDYNLDFAKLTSITSFQKVGRRIGSWGSAGPARAAELNAQTIISTAGGPAEVAILQPRTVGLSFSTKF